MPPKRSIADTDLYELFGLTPGATEQEIKQAYRKKALKCHPDKNPDNPKAVQLFLELSDALLILLDPKAKEAYDQTLKARAAARIRTQELDSKRRKLKEDLERREKAAKDASLHKKPISSEEALQFEIERLKKEGSRALRAEQESIRQEIERENVRNGAFIQSSVPTAGSALAQAPRLKVKSKGSLNYDTLMNVASKYGYVVALVVMKKSALIEFSSQKEANEFYASEKDNLTLEWVSKVIPSSSISVPVSASKPTSIANPPATQNFENFEATILKNLSQAIQNQNSSTSPATSN